MQITSHYIIKYVHECMHVCTRAHKRAHTMHTHTHALFLSHFNFKFFLTLHPPNTHTHARTCTCTHARTHARTHTHTHTHKQTHTCTQITRWAIWSDWSPSACLPGNQPCTVIPNTPSRQQLSTTTSGRAIPWILRAHHCHTAKAVTVHGAEEREVEGVLC